MLFRSRTIQHKGATYTIRHCNNLHATLGSAGPLKQNCLQCTARDEKALRFDAYANDNARLDAIQQEGECYSLTGPKHPPLSPKTYTRIAKKHAGHACDEQAAHQAKTCQKSPTPPRMQRKKKIPLSRITATPMADNQASSSRRTLSSDEEEQKEEQPPPRRSPRWKGRTQDVEARRQLHYSKHGKGRAL